LDGEGFILQEQQVFTRIRTGAAVVATGGGAPGSTIYTEVSVCTDGRF
jgi:shikimate kinase